MKIKELTILFLIILAVLKVRAGFTQEQKDALINFYKQNRDKINDEYINIKELYWDDERAKYAEVIIFKESFRNLIKIKSYKIYII